MLPRAETNAQPAVRPATAADVGGIHTLLHELAAFQGITAYFTLTPAQLLHDGFATQPPRYHALVAQRAAQLVGVALYYPRYSSWQGLLLHLEEFVVTAPARGQGIGSHLWAAVLEAARALGAGGLTLQVPRNDAGAMRFYRRHGVAIVGDTLNGYLTLPGA